MHITHLQIYLVVGAAVVFSSQEITVFIFQYFSGGNVILLIKMFHMSEMALCIVMFHCQYFKHLKHLSINISLNPKHQGGADWLGANHASIALSEWYRQHSSHSSTDATDVRPARLKCSGAEPGAAKPRKSELTGALTENALR